MELALLKHRNRQPNQSEQQRMCELLGDAMDAGACGFSAQLLGETSVQRDFDDGDLVELAGWHLSRTEARFAALFRLSNATS